MAGWRNTERDYGRAALIFHWLVVALILAQLAIGKYADELDVSAERLRWMSLHKSVGITILAIVLLRLVWRFMDRPPALPASMPHWERLAAHTVHWGLYALLIATPLAGWLAASADGLSTNWFGILPIPDLVGESEELAEVFEEAHELLIYALVSLAGLHILAAFRHGLNKDGVLARMLPFIRDRD